jgi:hypothetical protein
MAGHKSVFVSALTEVTTTQKDDLGDIRWVGNKVYKYVKLANVTATIAVVSGDPVAYLADTGYNEHTVVSDASDGATKPICAGVVGAACAAVHGGTVYYLWVQIKGGATINENIAGSTPADGDALYMSDDKVLTLAAAVDDPICAYAADDSAQLVIMDCVF